MFLITEVEDWRGETHDNRNIRATFTPSLLMTLERKVSICACFEIQGKSLSVCAGKVLLCNH